MELYPAPSSGGRSPGPDAIFGIYHGRSRSTILPERIIVGNPAVLLLRKPSTFGGEVGSLKIINTASTSLSSAATGIKAVLAFHSVFKMHTTKTVTINASSSPLLDWDYISTQKVPNKESCSNQLCRSPVVIFIYLWTVSFNLII